ncbi:MAG: AI-2E family transporter, partial [Pseudomonadota bacterium]
AFLIALFIFIPLVVQQANDFLARVPGWIAQLQTFVVSDTMKRIAEYLPFQIADVQGLIDRAVANGAKVFTSVLQSILTGGQFILSILSLLVITPVVAFYLLYDWDDMVAAIDGWLPRDHRSVIRRLVAEMSDMIAGFVRAQGLICLILAIFYAAALSLAGLNFGLLIGLMIGLISFIPFVGAILGAVVSIGVALAQFVPEQNYIMILVVAGIFVVGQFMEGNILQPRLMGNHVQLHPVWLMFALFAFGSLFGFVGMLVAVPAAACIGVLVRFSIERYLQSRLYLGTGGDQGPKSGAGGSE